MGGADGKNVGVVNGLDPLHSGGASLGSSLYLWEPQFPHLVSQS